MDTMFESLRKNKLKQYGSLKDDQEFLDALYRLVLGRPPDKGGIEHHQARLAKGEVSRQELVRDFILSDECRYNCLIKYPAHQVLFDFVEIADTNSYLPQVSGQPHQGAQLCELANPRKWLDRDWFAILREMGTISLFLDHMHRKPYELVQTVYGLRRLGALRENDKVLGVGAGHELLLYWLANQVGQVVATDLYEGDWSSRNVREGDPDVLENPAKYAPFPYREDHLEFMRMDGRQLEFPDQSFEVVYSLSSIEHFGGHAEAGRSVAEMGRVLKPGGVAAVATELIVNNKPHREFFLPGELLEHVVIPSGMKLVQAPVFQMPRHALEHPIKMPEERNHCPHLVLSHKGCHYTSVMLFFRKE